MTMRKFGWQNSLAPGKINTPTRKGMIWLRKAAAAILDRRDYVLQRGDADVFRKFAAGDTTENEDSSVIALIRAELDEPGKWEA